MIRRVKRALAHEQAQRILTRVSLAKRVTHVPGELSGGERQRVALARALVTQPACVLADEPTGNLDTERSIEIMQLLTELNQRGITILLVTHEAEMAAFARTIVHFRDGLVESAERGHMSGAAVNA
jgi:putative ABC transport system ATP-binding protein